MTLNTCIGAISQSGTEVLKKQDIGLKKWEIFFPLLHSELYSLTLHIIHHLRIHHLNTRM